MKSQGASIAKFGDNAPNEDAIFYSDCCIAVSDGAGGCGLYADEWSRYLLNQLPKDQPLCTYSELDRWVDGIWEPFYNEHEKRAKEGDGILLNKFYNEGSCATLAAAWLTGKKECRWMAYGDSVVFHYSRETGVFEHSFTRLADFSNPPRLVSCKDPLEEEGFRSGMFNLDSTSVVFATSDALAHYVLMMYELSRRDMYKEELEEELQKHTGNSQLLLTAANKGADFEKDVLQPLQDSVASEERFEEWMKTLYGQHVLDTDDYSVVILGSELFVQRP